MSEIPDLLQRTQAFAVASSTFYRRLPKTPAAQAPGIRYLRASGGVDLHYRAARRARSRAELLRTLETVVDHADECVACLELMRNRKVAEDERLLSEAKRLCALFTKSLKTAKRNV